MANDLQTLRETVNNPYLKPYPLDITMESPLLKFFRAVAINNPELPWQAFAPHEEAYPQQDLMGFNIPIMKDQIKLGYKKYPEFLAFHEGNHLWSGRSGEKLWMNARKYFNPQDFYDTLIKDIPTILQKYPIFNYSGYFKNQDLLKGLSKNQKLEELVSDLNAAILATGVDLTNDPDILTFQNPLWKEWFNSVTGYRSTRWDPRDQGFYKVRPELIK